MRLSHAYVYICGPLCERGLVMAPDLPYTTVGILLVTCTRGQNSSGGLMIIRRAVLAKVHGAYTTLSFTIVQAEV